MMEAATKLLFVVSVYCLLGVELVFSYTDPQDAAALVSLKNQWQNVPQSWEKTKDPCGAPWEGVTCNNNSRVTSLKLSSMNLKGTLTGDIGQLSHLQILSLNLNKFNGKIPATLGNLTNLYWLDLADNELEGTLPVSSNNTPGLDQLIKVQHLNLANNKLVGPFPNLTEMKALSYVDMSNNTFDISNAPTWFSTLQSLTTLILENVNLNGTVPQALFRLRKLQQVKLKKNQFSNLDMNTRIGPQLQLVDIQDNQITNFVPSGIYNHTLLLSGNTKVCGNETDYKDYCRPQALQLVNSYSTSLASCGPKPKVCEPNMKVDPQGCGCALPFSGTLYFNATVFPDLSNATIFQELETSLWTNLGLTPGSVFLQNPFDYIQIELWEGGYGKVYRGIFSSGQVVAVKRAQHGSMQGGLEFKTEIELLSRVRHENLVSLLGFCSEHGEQMLVYEFITNMSLRDSLAGRSGIYLDWKRRLRIAQDSARGLAHLHEHANPPIIHRDVKSTNILLDDQLTAKIADFGLSKLVQDTTRVHVTTQAKGTMGYLDPEYHLTNQLTEKSDVYSFGVVMLEIVTSKPPIDTGKYIVREVLLKLDNDKQYHGLEELMDPTLKNEANLVGFGRFIELAVQCVAESAADRPTMSDVVKKIEAILHDDRLNTNSPSLSSSAINSTSFGGSHPYNDVLPRKT